jgi:hypothetical protein
LRSLGRDDTRWGVCASIPSQHPQRLHVGFQDGFLFLALVGVLLAQAHDGAQRFDVEAVALALGVDVADTLEVRAIRVKATTRSSTARPQKMQIAIA